jgi:hypothetical protein
MYLIERRMYIHLEVEINNFYSIFITQSEIRLLLKSYILTFSRYDAAVKSSVWCRAILYILVWTENLHLTAACICNYEKCRVKQASKDGMAIDLLDL